MLVGGYVIPVPVAVGSSTTQGATGDDGDAAVCFRDPVGGGIAAAIAAPADGHDAADIATAGPEAARRAAQAAASTAACSGATISAVLAARRELDHDGCSGDVALVVVSLVADADGRRFSISWVGDCRGYRLRGRGLEQLTTDHTVAAQQHRRRQPITATMHDVLDTTIRTAQVDTIGHIRVDDLPWRLALSTRGIHRTVRAQRITRIVRTAHT